ncbi:hypothetical protein MAR_003936 [Mya arenaria]|uniref:C2 domain-containing protein n=1 Tax=Mya arenaria TaxID=6604 RepID=A0ABY7EYC1_MYAAR|nr:hypothetical protein MAR_003936 [Mya arenaria]
MSDLEGQFDTKLHEAVRYGDLEEVKVALQQGDPNKQDYLRSRTAMHYAAENGHVVCLQMLVDAGGKYHIKDSSGKDCLDVVTPGGRKILEKLRARDLLLKEGDITTVSDEGISSDQSQDASSLICSLGNLHVTVEYHSGKATLKVRIWQISDLLLPPPSTSMIHSIYVKSYLQPDKKKDSKRKTEEVKVDSSEGHIHWRRRKTVAVQHVFTPACFKFDRALEYSGITNEHIKEKSIQIEVCITQRYSHRSFLVGMVRMSLRSAVKKLVKEKIPLIPCMNHTIPTNMKVYSASELSVMNNTPGGDIFFSYPNVRIVLPEDSDDRSDKAASNPDLQRSPLQLNSPTVEVDMDSHYRFVQQVPKLDLSNMALDESGYSSEFHVSIPSEIESPDSNSSQSNISGPIHAFESSITQTQATVVKKTKATPNLEDISEDRVPRGIKNNEASIEITDLDEDNLDSVTIDTNLDIKKKSSKKNAVKTSTKEQQETTENIEIKVEPKSHLDKKDKKRRSRKSGKRSDENSGGSSRSRSQSPEWDFYDIPTEVVTQTNEPSVSPWKEGAAPVILPMETQMGIPNAKEQQSLLAQEKDKSIRRSKKKSSQPIPGKAVPVHVVPAIIVTQPSIKDKKGKKSSKVLQESAVVNMPESKEVVDEIEMREIVIHNKGKDEYKINAEKTGLKKIERKAFVNVGKALSLKTKPESVKPKENETKDKATDKTENESKVSKFKLKLRKLRKGKDPEPKITIDKNVPRISDIVTETDLTSVIVDKSSVSDLNQSGTGNEQETGSSVVLDMEKLVYQSSGAHVVELIEDDISITELGDNGQLFTDRSEAPSLMAFSDLESGFGDYHLPECKSPTNYMVPMQVYDPDDTSCDESLAFEHENCRIPTTEL